MLRWFVFVAFILALGAAADPNVHYQAHTAFFGDHPTPIVNMYIGKDSRQLNLILEFARPRHLPRREIIESQASGSAFFYGHPTVYLVPSRTRKIHYSDTFRESPIPGASSVELYSEGTFRNLHAEIIGDYREMPTETASALSPAKPPASLSYVSNGYHYTSGLLRIDGALFLGPESLFWQKFGGFVLEHSQLNLISLHTPVEPTMSHISALRIPCDLSILASDTTVNLESFEDFCSFEVYWPVNGQRYILTFAMTKPFSYLPEEIYRHYYEKDERKSNVDSYLAVEVGPDRDLLVLPPVIESSSSYMRRRGGALTPVIALGRDSIFFYRDIFGMQMQPTRELIIAPPHPYHSSVNFGPKTHTAITASSVFHVVFFVLALIAHFIFRGPTTNLLVRIGSYNSYDKYEMRIETWFQLITVGLSVGFTILTIVSPWRVHDAVFILGTIGAAIHTILLFVIVIYDPVPLSMRLGITPYYAKRNHINEPAVELKKVGVIPTALPSAGPTMVRKRHSLFAMDKAQVPLMNSALDEGDEKKKVCCPKNISKIYDTCSPNIYWVEDIPHVYYNLLTIDFIRSMVNVNSTIFLMLLFSLSYEFKFAFFSAIMLTQLLAITAVVYMVQCAIVVHWFTYSRRLSDSVGATITIFYGIALLLYYGIAGNILLYEQLLEANSFYPISSVPIEIAVLINVAGVLYAAFTFYNHIESLISNFSRIKLDQPDPTVHISRLSSRISTHAPPIRS